MKLGKQVVITMGPEDVESACRQFICTCHPQLAIGHVINPRLPISVGVEMVADGGDWKPDPSRGEVAVSVSPRLAPAMELKKRLASQPVFVLAKGGKALEMRARTTVVVDGEPQRFMKKLAIRLDGTVRLKAGADHVVGLSASGGLSIRLWGEGGMPEGVIGGFHVDLGGKVVPQSIWDLSFRPAAADPRGMVLVRDGKQKFWCDIYLMDRRGRSVAGGEIADGWKFLPEGYDKLRQQDAVELLAKHGKQLLSREEFALAADGVKEGQVLGEKPLAPARVKGLTSRFGLEQATGSLWVWSREKDGDDWPYILGGSWYSAGNAGPRRVNYDRPGSSNSGVGARGRSDHMELA